MYKYDYWEVFGHENVSYLGSGVKYLNGVFGRGRVSLFYFSLD